MILLVLTVAVLSKAIVDAKLKSIMDPTLFKNQAKEAAYQQVENKDPDWKQQNNNNYGNGYNKGYNDY